MNVQVAARESNSFCTSYWRDLLESPPSPDCSPESWTQSTLRSLHTRTLHSQSHTHSSLSHTHTITHTLWVFTLSHSVSHTLFHTPTLHAHALSLHMHAHSLSLSLSHTLALTHSLSLTHTTHSLSLSHTHTCRVGGEDREGHALSELLSDVLSQRRSGSKTAFTIKVHSFIN